MHCVSSWLPACALSLVLGWPAAARAEDAPVALEWHVPPGERCPSAADVIRQVNKLVGPPRRERAAIRARADVRKLPDGRFRVELSTLADAMEGHRAIEERSCTAMAEATAVILAWMVDPNVVEVPEPIPEQPAKPKAAPPPPREESQRSFKFVFGARGLLDSGTLPDVATGVGLELGLRWSWFRLFSRGGLWARQETEIAPSSGSTVAGASFRLLTLGVDACVTPWRTDIVACAGPELDRLEGTGFGVDTPRTDSASWIALTIGADGRIALVGPLGLSVGARLVVPTSREAFGLDGVAIVHRPGPVAGRLALGLDVVF